jgi:hypothetical protein
MSTFFIFAYLSLFLFLAIKKLNWALMLILAGLPLYLVRFSIFGIPSTLLEAMIIITFIIWLLKNFREIFENCKLKIENCLPVLRSFSGGGKIKNCKLKNDRYPFDTEIILLLIISFIAAGISGFDNAALGIWKAYFFEPALVYILIFNVFFSKNALGKDSITTSGDLRVMSEGNNGATSPLPPSRRGTFLRITNLIYPLVISAFIVSLIALAQKFGLLFSPENFWPRVTGPYGYPNALGLFVGPIIMLMAGALFAVFVNYKLQITNYKQENKYQFQILRLIFLFAAILLSIISIFFARSEGAMVGVLAALIVCLYLLFLFQKFIPLFVRKTGLGLLAIFLLAVLFYPVLALKVFPEHKYPDFGSSALNSLYYKAALKDFSGR